MPHSLLSAIVNISYSNVRNLAISWEEARDQNKNWKEIMCLFHHQHQDSNIITEFWGENIFLNFIHFHQDRRIWIMMNIQDTGSYIKTMQDHMIGLVTHVRQIFTNLCQCFKRIANVYSGHIDSHTQASFFLMIRGPTLSPVSWLCFAWEPSQYGN